MEEKGRWGLPRVVYNRGPKASFTTSLRCYGKQRFDDIRKENKVDPTINMLLATEAPNEWFCYAQES